MYGRVRDIDESCFNITVGGSDPEIAHDVVEATIQSVVENVDTNREKVAGIL